MKSTSLTKDFFISYSKADQHWAVGLSSWLKEEGYTVVVQESDFRPGANFVLEMDKATKAAKRTIAVLSPDYMGSSFTSSEWAAAFANDPAGEKRSLVPVLVRDCDTSGLLAQIIHINLIDLSVDDAHRRFLDGIRYATSDAPENPTASATPSKKSVTASPSVGQTIIGDQNIQAGGDVNINKKEVTRNVILREPGEISDARACTIKELIDKIVQLEVSSGRSTKQQAYGEWHGRLKRRYRVTSYKKLRIEAFDDATSWLKQQAAMLRPKLRRTNNQTWRNEHYRAIWSRWRALGHRKEEIYDFAYERLALKKPITSLKQLGERNLKKLHDVVVRMS